MQVLNIHSADEVRLDPAARPQPGPRDVVVKVRACGICGSDLTYIKLGGFRQAMGEPTPLGHEAAGEVIGMGAEVEGVALGQRVVINPMMTPSNMGNGGPDGAFGDEVLVREARVGDSLLPIPDDLPYDVAALAEPLAVALHGVNRAQVQAGEKVVVFGCGPIGLGMIVWLIDRGATDVVAVDIADDRLERARALGARATVNPARETLRERLLEIHGAGVAMNRPGIVGTDVYLDAAGAPAIIPDVIAMAKYHARLVVSAVYTKPIPFEIGRMLSTELTITTAAGYPTEMNDVVAALPRLKDKVATMISHRFALADVVAALGVAGSPSSAKVMIEMSA